MCPLVWTLELNSPFIPDKAVRGRMSPSDLRFIDTTKFELADLVHDMEYVSFERDEAIVGGGCIIETNLGDIDARIDKQFQVIEEAFKTEFERVEYKES